MPGEMALARAFVEIVPDSGGFKAKALSDVRAALFGVEGKVPVRLDSSLFKAQVAALKVQMVALARQVYQARLDADTTAAQAKLARMAAQLLSLDKTVSRPKIDPAGLVSAEARFLAIKSTFEGLNQAVTRAAPAWRGFWGVLNRPVALFGGVATITGLHLLIDSIAEVAAVVIPAGIALGAFGAAAVPTVTDLFHQMQNLNTVVEATGKAIPPLTGGFSRVADAVKPQVYSLFGDALQVINSRTGEFSKLTIGAGTAMDLQGARTTIALKSAGISVFLANATTDLAKLGDVIGNIFGTVGNVLKALPGYAQVLLNILDNVTKGLEAISGNVVVQGLLKAGLAMHGLGVYAGLAATGVLALAPLLARTATWAFGIDKAATATANLAAGASRLDKTKAAFADIGNAVSGSAVSVGRFSAEGERGASIFARFGGAVTGLISSPWTWAVVGAAVVGFLAVKILTAKDATQQWVGSLQDAISRSASFSQVIDATQNAVIKLGVAQRGAATSIKDLTTGQNTFGASSIQIRDALAAQQQRLRDLAAGSAAYRAELHLEDIRVAELVARFGSVAKAQQIWNVLHLKSIDLGKASASTFKNEVQAAESYESAVRAVASAMGHSGTGAYNAALNALNNTFITGTLPAIQQVASAESNLTTLVTSGRVNFGNFQQTIQGTTAKFKDPSGLAAAAKLAGASMSGLNEQSRFLQNTFYAQVIPAAQALIGSLQQQGISTGHLTTAVADEVKQMIPFVGKNKEARAVMIALINNALGPGTVSLQTLNKWVGQNSGTLRGFNAIIAKSTIKAGTLAGVIQTQLNKQFAGMIIQTSGASGAMKTYTSDLQHNQDSTAKGRRDRQHLITDLENAGLSAKDAKKFVDNMQTSIDKMHGKNVQVGVHGSGSGGVSFKQSFPGQTIVDKLLFRAGGGMVPGWGHGDSVPAMLTPGEAVVPKRLVGAVAPILSAGKVPGFASGGFVGLEGEVGRASGVAANIEGKFMTHAMTDAIRSAIKLVKSAGSAFGNFGAGAPGGSNAANAQLARRMMPAWGSGAEWAAWNYLAMRESGWSSTIANASSGALGIAQALGHGVSGGGGSLGNQYGGYGLSLAGDRAANSGNAGSQIEWMVNYIRDTRGYGDPLHAAAHERAYNWYDSGGWLPRGRSIAINNTGKAERVLGPHDEMKIKLEFGHGPHGSVEAALWDWLLKSVDVRGGGDVQVALGRKY